MKAALVVLVFVFSSVNCNLELRFYAHDMLEGIHDWHRLCKLYSGTTTELIEGVKKGQFPDDESSIQRYNFCLWSEAGELDSDYRIIVPKMMTYLTNVTKQDAVHYIKCNEMALSLADKDPVQKIWEMEKCVYKRIDNKRFIYY
ncbi:unnamed protein product [Diabrotica balteata]|uniref:Uncharacterized protein n=1 Tax=Diabrotica balteata TaxID=107213 RepID=A0A9N9X8J8_DIABA|nr:unnamed protein product [Diabrotica balteata]